MLLGVEGMSAKKARYAFSTSPAGGGTPPDVTLDTLTDMPC